MKPWRDGLVLAWALKYAERGWHVFPLHTIVDGACSCGVKDCPDAGKHPRVKQWAKESSVDKARLMEWFGPSGQPSNIAIVTGAGSGITVLDIDIGEGKDGDKTWQEIHSVESQNPEPVTLTGITGSGGMHMLFKYNSALTTSSGTLGKGIDCRNDRGYIVAPPSLHRKGGEYKWQEWAVGLSDLPAHLSKKKDKRGRPRGNDPTRKKYTIEQVAGMLKFVKADDRDVWRKVGIVLGREFARAEAAWSVYVEWAEKWDGEKGRNHDAIMRGAFYEDSQEAGDLTLGSVIKLAIDGGWTPAEGQVPLSVFLYYAPGNNFIYRSTGTFWSAESVDAACGMVNQDGALMKASDSLKRNALVTSMTNDPAIEEEIVKGWDYRDGAVLESKGAALYNAYRGPTIELGDARLAQPFLRHLGKVFPREGDADQFLNYMAHRVQCPGEKPRFALLIAGEQGVGKDTALSMCYPAIGIWNVANIEPIMLDQGFNQFASAVLVVISEAANTHEMSRWAFNERTKNLIAGLPDYITINPKYGHQYSVRLHNGTVVTTNHMLTGLYIPADDRRYDVIEAATKAEMGIGDVAGRVRYFEELWDWYYAEEGARHVAALLHERDLSRFSAAQGQRITQAHNMVVAAGFSADTWLEDAIGELNGEGDIVRMDELFEAVNRTLMGEMSKQQFSSKLGHCMNRAGYKPLHNPDEKDGRWNFAKKVFHHRDEEQYGQRRKRQQPCLALYTSGITVHCAAGLVCAATTVSCCTDVPIGPFILFRSGRQSLHPDRHQHAIRLNATAGLADRFLVTRLRLHCARRVERQSFLTGFGRLECWRLSPVEAFLLDSILPNRSRNLLRPSSTYRAIFSRLRAQPEHAIEGILPYRLGKEKLYR